MSSELDDNLRQLIKNGVRTVIERSSDKGLKPPTQTFHKLSSNGFIQNTEKVSVRAPGDLFNDGELFNTLYAGEFSEAARLIYDQLPEPLDGDQLSEAERINSIEQGLFEFVGVVLNYTGNFQFDEDAFVTAFEEQFEPRFTDREYSRFLLVLKNTSIEPDITIDLKTEIQGSPDYLGPYAVDTLRIRPLDRLEEVGIATHESPEESALEPLEVLDTSGPNAALEIVLRRRRPYRSIAREIDDTEISPWARPDFDVTPVDVYPWQQLTNVIEYLAASVRRCLRLLCPIGVVGYEKGYHLVPGWETYRGIGTPATFELEFECPSSTTGTHLAEDRALEIRRAWEAHRHQLTPDNDRFQNPLSRFERMFSRESLEDQLVDCVVGCETTVLKGGSPGGNKYRLGVRTAVLLGDRNNRYWSSDRVGEFFRTMYEYRNKVVHEDTTLPDKPSSGERIAVGEERFIASTFLVRARELYANLILEYLNLVTSQDMSLQEINKQIDNRTLEHGVEIREELF